MGTSAIRVTDGVCVFPTPHGSSTAFRDLNLDVHDGEIHALIGPSGCGKSTLLRIIAGLDELTSGILDVPRYANGRPKAGIVFQDAHLLPWLTVRDNVALGLRYRANRQINLLDVDRLLAVLGIAPLAGAMPTELSGGQAQRVAIARTAVTAPPLLLLDEPFAALDPLTRRGLQDWLRHIRDLLGFTVVLVTHDVDEAVHLGDRVSLMRGGHRGVVATYDTATATRGSHELHELREALLDCYADDERQALSAHIPQ